MSAKRLRGPSSTRRRGPRRAPAATLLVSCEGAVTERHYILDLARSLRASSVTVARDYGEPKYLVEKAVEYKRARGKGRRAYDLIWCVFDADDHERLADALIQARDNNIPVALSNPCFEIWALLHLSDQTAYIERAPLRQKVQALIPGYDKRLPFERLAPGQEDATRRAKALVLWHAENGSPETENPSTGVWQLVEAIGALRTAP